MTVKAPQIAGMGCAGSDRCRQAPTLTVERGELTLFVCEKHTGSLLAELLADCWQTLHVAVQSTETYLSGARS